MLVAIRLKVSRSPVNENFQTAVTCPRCASAMKTRPTGFSSVPPPGPAMPVVDKAKSAPLFAHAPSAIAIATGSLIGVWATNEGYDSNGQWVAVNDPQWFFLALEGF